MVLSKKPLHFFIAALVAFLPLVSSANPEVDSTKVAAGTSHAIETAHEESD